MGDEETSIEQAASKLVGLGRGGFSGAVPEKNRAKRIPTTTQVKKPSNHSQDSSKSVSRITFWMYDEVNGMVKRLASKLTDRARNAGIKTTVNRDMVARCWLKHIDVLPWDASAHPLATEAELDKFIKSFLNGTAADKKDA